MEMEKLARWAFIACVIIAIVMGLVVGYMFYNKDSNFNNTNAYVTLVLLILGIIVGLINITATEVTPFLIVAIALIVASISNVWSPLSTIHELLADWATFILNYIVAFVAPAAVIIAIKAALAMEKS
jgi:asparagine N-glycosylation enzyme membrane subunit Stt3